MSPNELLSRALWNRDEALFEVAITKGADTNFHNGVLSVLDSALINQRFDMYDKLIEFGATPRISVTGMTIAFSNANNFAEYMNIMKKHAHLPHHEELYSTLRANGANLASTHWFLHIYKFLFSLQAVGEEQNFGLSLQELSILDDRMPCFPIEDYLNTKTQNQYEFTPLQLSIMGKRYDLLYEMIKAGGDINETHPIGDTLRLFLAMLDMHPKSMITAMEMKMHIELVEKILDQVSDVDQFDNDGESVMDQVTDISIGSTQFTQFFNRFLQRSKDPLFLFIHQGSELLSLSPGKTHIAISFGREFWSTGVSAMSRLVSKNHHDVEFHIVTLDIINRGGDEFIKQFDGWINPGAGDSFPADMSEFAKTDWQPRLDIEQIYQLSLAKTEEFHIPYLGMCAGAQNFVLYSNGFVSPLQGYDSGKHTISYIEGTLSHYQSMTAAQQMRALKTCEFPKIEFLGDTAHYFAAVRGKLGSNIQLGAISEDGVPMSYAHMNGIRFATQFHPEHYYNNTMEEGINYQETWLENFVYLAKMHHEFMYDDGVHPESYMDDVQFRLEQCMVEKVCMGDL